jgi:hypothetical protein
MGEIEREKRGFQAKSFQCCRSNVELREIEYHHPLPIHCHQYLLTCTVSSQYYKECFKQYFNIQPQ